MRHKLLTRPVKLNIDGKVITFKSMDDFEFAMAARTLVPQKRITEALNATQGELHLQTNAMVIAIEQISELIDPSLKSADITQKLKAINPVIFSNDNNWRDIFFGLKKDKSTESSEYKLIALNAYLQYLTNRKEMAESIQERLEKNHDNKENSETALFKTGELDIDKNFDSRVLAKELGMKNMPTAEYVVFKIKEDDEIALLLANYQCKLVIKKSIKFIDHENIEHPIMIGMNKIGRGRECNIRFTDTTQRISRLHLIIINHDNKKLELTDLSTYGTHYLKK